MKGKRIILGICGGIAAYKMAVLTRLLVKAGAEVQVIMTREAQSFIGPLTLATLSGKPVLNRLYHRGNGTWTNHVELGLWADLMLIAPATANSISAMASGKSDNLLLTTYLSARCPVWVAPAMDLDMWNHPATQRNIRTLQADGLHIIPPAEGELASGLSGPGRLPEPEELFEELQAFFQGSVSSALPGPSKLFKGIKALITAGPTYEAIDPVRYIGNHSSGKMGIALADELAALGAEVRLIKGPGSLHARHPAVEEVPVSSAEDMHRACQEHFENSDVFIAAAAVADYRPKESSKQKIKKNAENNGQIQLELVKTTDILAAMSQRRREDQVLVGFALETENEQDNALRKLREKKLNFIVLNSLNDPGAGFGGDDNQVSLIEGPQQIDRFPLSSKQQVARIIIDRIAQHLQRIKGDTL